MGKLIIVLLVLASCRHPQKITTGKIVGKEIEYVGLGDDVYWINVKGYNQMTCEFDADVWVPVSPEEYYTNKLGDTYNIILP